MPLSIEDRLEILELYATYSHCYDGAEAEFWAALFAPDATFTVRPWGGYERREFRGTAELAAFVRDRHENKYGKRGIRHAVSNILIEATESGAKGTAYVIEMRVGDGQPPQVTLTCRYEDEFVKGPQGWRFASRTVVPDV